MFWLLSTTSYAAHRALSVSDVLEEILERLPNSGRAISARVSSQWLEASIKKLWKDPYSVLPLLKLVSELSGGYSRGCRIEFRRPPRNVQWSRFALYAHHIQSITWNDEKGTLSNDIFAQILIHRPQVHSILPNIRAMTWTASYDDTVMQLLPLTSDSLKILHLNIKQGCSSESVATTLKGLDDRGVCLEDLRIEAWFGVRDIEITLASFLCDQLELKVVGLPQYYGTKDIIAVLGSLPKLESLYTTNCVGEVEDGMNWELGEGSIRNLSSFGFNAPLWMASRILKSNSLSNLSRLSVTPPSSGAINGSVYAFFDSLALHGMGLRSIHLSLCQYPSTFNPITPADLQPLFHLKSLEVLEIDGRKPFVGIDSGFVEDMAHYWPSLRRLHLAPLPTDGGEANIGTPLSILHAFAHHFDPTSRCLESIGLYFKSESKKLLDTQGTHAFPTLRELDVGTSCISSDDVHSVAAFLAGLCSPGLAICSGRRSGELNSRESDSVAVWRQVGASLRVLHDFQSPLRYRLEVLEHEARKPHGKAASWKRVNSIDSLSLSPIAKSGVDQEGATDEVMRA
ncbi:hypothetical protein FRB98_006920 [Tulasnella sp. 332]|nr:hypothetical protein FRB98_006920 [Tulasnella sp. 332]